MNFNICTTELPSESELQILFSQTSWANKRKTKDIKKMIENLNVFVTVRENSKLIGFGRAISDGIYRALIDDVVVDKNYRKQGFGKIIVENLLVQLEEVDEIFLNTKPELEGFYNNFGFHKFHGMTMKK